MRQPICDVMSHPGASAEKDDGQTVACLTSLFSPLTLFPDLTEDSDKQEKRTGYLLQNILTVHALQSSASV